MNVSLLYVFGSRARQIAGWLTGSRDRGSSTDSDVDIGVRSRGGVVWSVAEKVLLAQALEDLFGCTRVDLVVLGDADPFLAAEIIRGERLYADDSYEADQYDLYVLRCAGDLAPLERERQALIHRRVITDRLALIDEALADIRALPLADRSVFFADRRNIWAAESCLRRALEAPFDVGRHILAKGHGRGVSEYKEIATTLAEVGVLTGPEAAILRVSAGYRNRLVHYYHEISADELYAICTTELRDVEMIAGSYRRWVAAHPERIDPAT
jgi:uncharacterized protein YutE (UPF0331/DUF86 family)/predicted nucleotidyltransferase